MSEKFDIYDAKLNHLGVKDRDEVHRDGNWHRTFHCWVIYRDDAGLDWVIMQKRAANKETFPNKIDVSAAGHLSAGESPLDGVREIEEELGLQVDPADLIPAGRRVTVIPHGEILDCEVAEVFLYICDQPLQDYVYQEDELAGLVRVNPDEVLRLFAQVVDEIHVPAIGFQADTIAICREDFIPSLDFFIEKSMILAKRCLNGEEYLFI